jgi:hypothetical protein
LLPFIHSFIFYLFSFLLSHSFFFSFLYLCPYCYPAFVYFFFFSFRMSVYLIISWWRDSCVPTWRYLA